jgi:histidine triad (HIT) family protein
MGHPYDARVSADCLFCRIVAGEIPATVVHETPHTVAFRDINPQAPTHVVVVTRAHHPDAGAAAEADPALAGEMLRAARAVAESEGIADVGYRLVFNTGSAAGQTVFHVHCHVLGGRTMTWPPG